MTKNLKLIQLFFLLIFTVQNLLAQEEKPKFSVNAELRIRSNILYGYKQLPTEENSANLLIEQRTRLGFKYQTKQLEMNICLQDTRIWGDENIYTSTKIIGDSASMSLKEAWAKINFNNFWSLKIGRQAIQLDEGRLLGYRNWNNTSSSHDAALIQFHKNNFNLDLALSYNNSAMNLFAAEYNTNRIKSMNYIYMNKKFNKDFSASFLSIFTGSQAAGSTSTLYFENTTGTYLKYNNKQLFAKAEFYYQSGKTLNGVDVNAYFFNTDLGYTIDKIYFGFGIDYLSGQKQNTSITDEFQAFDILYGTRVKYYGNLSYFTNPTSTRYGGLLNPYLRTIIKWNKRNSLKTTFLFFQSAQKIPVSDLQNSFFDKNIGTELDIIYTYKFADDINIKAGYHIGFPTETLEILKGLQPRTSKTPQWFWLSFLFKPTLFSSK